MSYNINKERVKDIYIKLNNIIDEYLDGRTAGTRHVKSVLTKSDYEKYFDDTKKTIHDAKKDFLKAGNFSRLLDDIKWVNANLFDSKDEYKLVVKKMLIDLFKDRIAADKDKVKKIKENMVTKFNNFKLNENKLSFDEYVEDIAIELNKRFKFDGHNDIDDIISHYRNDVEDGFDNDGNGYVDPKTIVNNWVVDGKIKWKR